MFSQACIIPSVHEGEGMMVKGVCMVGGCVAGAMYGGGVCGRRDGYCSGTHPTGMHSC